MPVDVSKESARDRRSTPVGLGPNLEARRSRGEISCAECRRLKLRCDKKVPCTSCTRRGVATLCPNGTLSTGQGSRPVLADTVELHAKIAEMSERIRQLEHALALAHGTISSEPHSLLVEPLLSIKYGVHSAADPQESLSLQDQEGPNTANDPFHVEAVGTVTVGRGDELKYFGPSAGSEALFIAGANAHLDQATTLDEVPSGLPLEIQDIPCLMSTGFHAKVYGALSIIFKYFPSKPRAETLCDNYLTYSACAFRPITREELFQDFLHPIHERIAKYKEELKANVPSLPLPTVCPHRLAVLFLAFALGAIADQNLIPDNEESALYFRLACCCLGLRSIFDSPEVGTVQALALLSTYHGAGGKWYTLDSAWVLAQVALVIAQSLGMRWYFPLDVLFISIHTDPDRDPAKWTTNQTTIQRRRALFWELMSNDQFFSCAVGRPPYARLPCIDTEFPEDTFHNQDETFPGYYRWKYIFMTTAFPRLLETLLGTKPPQYGAVVELDKAIRAQTLPPEVSLGADDHSISVAAYVQKWLLLRYQAVSLLYLHRAYFVQAMFSHPKDPLQSPFASSFLAAYKAASDVIKTTISDFDQFPKVTSRFWGAWTHLLSAAIVVGSVVIHAPTSAMGPAAYIELGLACALFEKGAKESMRARSGMALLNKIRDRANQTYSRFLVGHHSAPTTVQNSDELSIFGGQTRVIVSQIISKDSPFFSTSNTSPSSPESGTTYSPSPVVTPGNTNHGQQATPDALVNATRIDHPAVMEFFNQIPFSDWQNQVSEASPQEAPRGDAYEAFRFVEPPNVNTSPPWKMPWGQVPSETQALPQTTQTNPAPPDAPLLDDQWIPYMHAFGLADVLTAGTEVQSANAATLPRQYYT